MALNEQEQKYVENMRSMFQTDGWKALTSDMEEKLSIFKDAVLHPELTLDELRILQGRSIVIKEIINLPNMIDAIVKSREEEAPPSE